MSDLAMASISSWARSPSSNDGDIGSPSITARTNRSATMNEPASMHLVVIRKRVWDREFSRYCRRAVRVPSADSGDDRALVRLEYARSLLAEAGADDPDT